MPMIALSPDWWCWQKTTCSWWGIANTLVTVATLFIPFRFLVGPVPMGGLRGFIDPAAAAGFARGRARRGDAPGHHHPVDRGAGAGERARLRAARGWHYLCVSLADQAALPAGLRPDAVRFRRSAGLRGVSR